MRSRLLVLVALFAVLFAFVSPARAVEHTFAGSAQVDYLAVPTQPDGDANRNGTGQTFDGFTLEAAVKASVDVTSHLSANVKLCYGCHGFELDMAYFDLRVVDELNFRLGRFSPSFGSFNLRHDPANQKLSDKPLPYDMGRMLRRTEWGEGVLPSPFPDNGGEIDGTHWFGTSAQLDYAAYGIVGFRNNSTGPVLDLNFAQSHGFGSAYYVDNNARPAAGARVALTLKPSGSTDLTLGTSGMGGTYDNANQLTYIILGGDASLRVHRTNLRAEYLVRRTEFAPDPALLKYALAPNEGNYFVKHGAYVELEQPIAQDLDAVVRVDGLLRIGNVAAGSYLTDHSWMARGTLGLAYGIERNLRLKGSVEYYEFSEADTSGNLRDVAIHLGVTGSF